MSKNSSISTSYGTMNVTLDSVFYFLVKTSVSPVGL